VRSQKRILGGVACLIGVPHHQERGSEGKILVPAHQLLVRGHLTVPRCLNQLRVIQWTALHLCHPYTTQLTLVPNRLVRGHPVSRAHN
jgi:hypothetical protein